VDLTEKVSVKAEEHQVTWKTLLPRRKRA